MGQARARTHREGLRTARSPRARGGDQRSSQAVMVPVAGCPHALTHGSGGLEEPELVAEGMEALGPDLTS